jgi:hypothetical protein
LPQIIPFEEDEAAAEQQCGAKDQDADQRDEIRTKRTDRGSGCVWAIIVIVFEMPVVMMMCATNREWSIHVGIGAGDDRQTAMIEAWHIPGGPDKPQRKQQR